MKISEALRKERQDRNLKQKDMIKNLAISKSHYSQIEHGKHRIYAEDLLKMLADNNIDYHHFLMKWLLVMDLEMTILNYKKKCPKLFMRLM